MTLPLPHPLRVVSCMADNAEPFAYAVAQALGRAMGVPVDFVVDHPWPQREQMLYDGEVHVASLQEHAAVLAKGRSLQVAEVEKGAQS